MPYPPDCAEVKVEQPNAPSGIYNVDPDGPGPQLPFQVYCEMGVDGGGWTLVASFVNDGVISWTQARSDASFLGNWRNTSVFGQLANRATADFKSLAYVRIPGNDVLAVDDGGNWARFGDVLGNKALLARVLQETACTTSPVLLPGSNKIATSRADALPHLLFGFYGADPNNAGNCAFSNSPDSTDSSVVYMFAGGCATAGFGHLGWYDPAGPTNYDFDSFFCLSSPVRTDVCGAGYYGVNISTYPGCTSTVSYLYVR